jgi:hypothetical protein
MQAMFPALPELQVIGFEAISSPVRWPWDGTVPVLLIYLTCCPFKELPALEEPALQ